MDQVLVSKATFEKLHKELTAVMGKIGSYRTGDDFVDQCRGLYNNVSKIKDVGLALKRAKGAMDELVEEAAKTNVLGTTPVKVSDSVAVGRDNQLPSMDMNPLSPVEQEPPFGADLAPLPEPAKD